MEKKKLFIKEGVNYDITLIERLSGFWFTKEYELNSDFERWRKDLKSGRLARINPVIENDKLFRQRKL
jgi:hypothetical protein